MLRDRLVLQLQISHSDPQPALASAVTTGTVYYISVAKTERTPTGWELESPPE